MKQTVKIETPIGEGIIDNIYVSELGFLMLRVKISDRWVSYNLGKHDKYDNMFSRLILPNRWIYQYISIEDLWYLSHHHPLDGVLEELFFDTEHELLTYVSEHNIKIDDEK